MSTVSSPARFSGDFDGFYDANFTADISNKMRVPHRIRVVGNGDEGDNQFLSSKNTENENKLEMYVPGRILVAGQDQHIGLKSPPRELHLEQSMLPPPSTIRVQTPPRVLTLEDHPFPSVDEERDAVVPNHITTSENNLTSRNTSTFVDQSMTLSYPSCPSTPPLNPTSDVVASTSDEIILLRRHLAKLGRRVLILENDSQQRQQREVIVYTLGVAYFLLKTLFWLNRHW